MKIKDHYLKEIYDIDPENNAYIIEVALDDYTDIFSEWDPAPFKRRDLDPDLEEYLLAGAAEIPFKEPLKICFILPPGKMDRDLEAASLAGLNNSFIYKRYQLQKSFSKSNFFAVRYLLIGFLFLWLGSSFPVYLAEGLVSSLLSEGIFIGGWVFIWEAVYQFFFQNREFYALYKQVKRLQLAPIAFRESTL